MKNTVLFRWNDLISIVVPAYNEEKRIARTIYMALYVADEVVVVADGSDETSNIVETLKSHFSNVKLVDSNRRLGKGGAFFAGAEKSLGDKVFLVDADFPVSPLYVPLFVQMLDEYDIVVGVRKSIGEPFSRKLMSRGYKSLVKVLFRLPVKDTQCGFKAFRRNVLENLNGEVKTTGYSFDLELLIKALKLGFTVKEIPVEYHYGGNSKVSWKDIYEMTKETFKIHRDSLGS